MQAPAKLTAKQVKGRYNWEAAWHLFIAGATLEETSNMLAIPYSTMVSHASKCQWAARRTQALEVAREAIKTDLKGRVEKARVKHQEAMMDLLDETMAHIETTPISDENPVERKLAAMDKQDVVARRVLGMDKESDNDPMKAGFLLLASIGHASLVNENTDYEEAQVVEDIKCLPDTINSTQSQTTEGDQNNPLPLPNPSDDPNSPLTGILRSGNGMSNGSDNPTFHPFAPLEPKFGETGPTLQPKPMPKDIVFTPPNPLVNETPTNE